MTNEWCDSLFPVLPCSAVEIAAAVLERDRRVLLFGSPGTGKTTLAAQLARVLAVAGRPCWCISADPGSPGFGIPGVVALGEWRADTWRVAAIEALCSLDAGRFRLPLISAVRRLTEVAPDGVGLLDAPGVVRGVAGSELLTALVEAAQIDLVLVLARAGRPPPLLDELRALGREVFMLPAAAGAARPGKRLRALRRTKPWNDYLADAAEQRIETDTLNVLGTPPPRGETIAWAGRQVGLLAKNRTVAMGEVLRLQGKVLSVLLPAGVERFDTLLMRDATRTADGVMETAVPFATEQIDYIPAPKINAYSGNSGTGPRVVGRVGSLNVSLVNGVFGDPMLHLRLRHQRRSLLFDLGEGERLPARIAHQITDVFISHAHMDHIGGFPGLLRSRIGEFPVCRFYGPPGLARHIEGFIQGFLWDRVAQRGPCFEIAELHGGDLRRFRLQVGVPGLVLLEEKTVTDGVLLDEPGFRVCGTCLDHHTPVIAYAFEPARQINIRKDRLLARHLTPGPWLTTLKKHLTSGNPEARVELPDGTSETAGELGTDLAFISPGKKLVYATDLCDTPDNRQRLVALAKHAHTFFCEAPFSISDTEAAAHTGHLTTRACGEIAAEAEVARLVPFHFSRRYTHCPQQLYEEIRAVCTRVVVPEAGIDTV